MAPGGDWPGRLALLNRNNPQTGIFPVEDSRFGEYGQIVEGPPPGELFDLAGKLFTPGEGTSYTASSPELEAASVLSWYRREIFGETDIQAGCCRGYNTRMNGMEYHKSSELLGAATEMVLILGRVQDIRNNRWNSQSASVFYVPPGVMIELYATTLHFAPCRAAQDPFYAVIILPRGTNTPLGGTNTPLGGTNTPLGGTNSLRGEKNPPLQGALWMKNKWLLAHPQSPAALKGAWPGVDGPNLEIFPL